MTENDGQGKEAPGRKSAGEWTGPEAVPSRLARFVSIRFAAVIASKVWLGRIEARRR